MNGVGAATQTTASHAGTVTVMRVPSHRLPEQKTPKAEKCRISEAEKRENVKCRNSVCICFNIKTTVIRKCDLELSRRRDVEVRILNCDDFKIADNVRETRTASIFKAEVWTCM
jgi:hypothetical protein